MFFIRQIVFLLFFINPVLITQQYANILDGLPSVSKYEKMEVLPQLKKIVQWTQKIEFVDYPRAFNPTLLRTSDGFLLAFRYCPIPIMSWYSCIGIVLLDDNFSPKSVPRLLNFRFENKKIAPQQEDPRLFELNGEIYILFNDNDTIVCPTEKHRRDIYLSKLTYEDERFVPSRPIKLFHGLKYSCNLWQKNWVPFEWNNNLMICYTTDPHEILITNFEDGHCKPVYFTQLKNFGYKWGHLRGGTPAQLVDGEYLSFFHSSTVLSTNSSNMKPLRHYYMGAYTFSPEPPFNIKKITTFPIIADGFYTPSDYDKRVIFPGGFVSDGEHIYIAYGKDDCEIWIAKIDKKELLSFMKDIN